MAQIKALVIKDLRTATIRAEELPTYVSSPRAGRTAYLEYCRRTRNEGTPERRRARLIQSIDDRVGYVRSIAESITNRQKELNTARANIKRYEQLIAEGSKVDPKDLTVYAQEFDSIPNLEGVSEIGINNEGQFFVVFMARRQLKNGKWCDFGDWKVHPSISITRDCIHAGLPTSLRKGTRGASREYSYPHYLGYFCWGSANGTMRTDVESGRYFEVLSYASQALTTFYSTEERCAEYFNQIGADDRPAEVKIDPRARQHYIDTKVTIGSNYEALLRDAREVVRDCNISIEEWAAASKEERAKLTQMRQELAEVERQIAEAIDPEVAWAAEFEAVLALPEVLAVKVYDYDDVQSLKFVIRLRHRTRRCVYYLGDYEIDFKVARYGLEYLGVNRLKTGLVPDVENGDVISSIHQYWNPSVRSPKVDGFSVDKGEMLGKLRAIIQYLSTPTNPQYPARHYHALQEV